MTKEQELVSKEVRDVQTARWDGFKWLAKQLPNHHVLAVELIRTRNDETAAVFTVVKQHEPVQYVVFGDALGKVKAHDSRHITTSHEWTAPAVVAKSALTASSPPPTASSPPAAPDYMALGDPPPKQPPPPGIISLAAVLLPASFDMGEQISAK